MAITLPYVTIGTVCYSFILAAVTLTNRLTDWLQARCHLLMYIDCIRKLRRGFPSELCSRSVISYACYTCYACSPQLVVQGREAHVRCIHQQCIGAHVGNSACHDLLEAFPYILQHPTVFRELDKCFLATLHFHIGEQIAGE